MLCPRERPESKYSQESTSVYSIGHSCGVRTVSAPSVCTEVFSRVWFVELSGGNVGGEEDTERGGRGGGGGHSMVRGFLKGILSLSRHLHHRLTKGRVRVNVSAWLPEWCVFSSQVFVVHELPGQQEPQITGMELTRLPEVRLSQASVYDSWWSESPWQAGFNLWTWVSSFKWVDFSQWLKGTANWPIQVFFSSSVK